MEKDGEQLDALSQKEELLSALKTAFQSFKQSTSDKASEKLKSEKKKGSKSD